MRFFSTLVSGLALTSSVLAQLSSDSAAGSAVATGTTPESSGTAPSTGGTGALAINDFPSTGARAGQATTITYTAPNSGPVTIVLRKGDPNALDTVETLTTTATGGSFTWTPSTSLEPGSDYALEIRQGGVTNYSAQFGITGGTGTPSSKSSAAPSSSSSAAESSSASDSSSAASTSAPASSAGSSSGSSTPTSRSPSNTASRSASPSTSVPGAGAMKTASPVALFAVVGAMVALN